MATSKRKKRRVFVTGLGVISPLGADTLQNLRSLREGRDAVQPVTSFDVTRNRCKTAGQIPDNWLALATESKRAKRYHRGSLMMVSAMREALAMAKNPLPEMAVMATSSGAMSNGEAFYRGLKLDSSRRRHPRLVANYLPQKPVLDALHARF